MSLQLCTFVTIHDKRITIIFPGDVAIASDKHVGDAGLGDRTTIIDLH